MSTSKCTQMHVMHSQEVQQSSCPACRPKFGCEPSDGAKPCAIASAALLIGMWLQPTVSLAPPAKCSTNAREKLAAYQLDEAQRNGVRSSNPYKLLYIAKHMTQHSATRRKGRPLLSSGYFFFFDVLLLGSLLACATDWSSCSPVLV